MNDAFKSFCDISADRWVINIRGKYKLKALFFLKDKLGEKLFPYLIESGKGWFHDTRQIVSDIDSDYIMFWVEDHLNLVDVYNYDEILKEMHQSGSEYLNYTWWFLGKAVKVYDQIAMDEYAHIKSFLLTKADAAKLTFFERKPYLISIPSFYSNRLFKKIVYTNDPKLRRWPKDTPFDFEKKGTDYHWLPLKMAIPKYELFACIDDDNGVEGYSLQSRGLYPARVLRAAAAPPCKPNVKKVMVSFLPEKLKKYLKRISYHF